MLTFCEHLFIIDLEHMFRTNVRGVEMKRYRVINKKRFYLFISTLLIILLTAILLMTNSIKVHSVVFDQEYKEIQILHGDTLWSIAVENMPNDYDTRYLVYTLKEFNDLETAYIYPGDIIRIPILK